MDIHRVKVYKLNEEGTWDDKGTGHINVEYMEVGAPRLCPDRAAVAFGRAAVPLRSLLTPLLPLLLTCSTGSASSWPASTIQLPFLSTPSPGKLYTSVKEVSAACMPPCA